MNAVDKELLEDFQKVLANSPLLTEAYSGLPLDQRQKVDDHFIELMWQMIFSGTQALPLDVPRPEAQRIFKEWGSFILSMRKGKNVRFNGPGFVAVDNDTWRTIEGMERPLNAA